MARGRRAPSLVVVRRGAKHAGTTRQCGRDGLDTCAVPRRLLLGQGSGAGRAGLRREASGDGTRSKPVARARCRHPPRPPSPPQFSTPHHPRGDVAYRLQCRAGARLRTSRPASGGRCGRSGPQPAALAQSRWCGLGREAVGVTAGREAMKPGGEGLVACGS
eukprot:scaffold24475_cov90-Isochrysis_galbana.AAC.1